MRGTLDVFCALAAGLRLRGYSYDPVFLLVVFYWPRTRAPCPPAFLQGLFASNTSLLPPDWQPELSLRDVQALVRDRAPPPTPTEKHCPPGHFVQDLLDSPDDDDLAKRFYPPRTKADLAIRTSRFADLITLPFVKDVLKRRLTALLGFDYITAANVLSASFLFEGMAWWDFWADCGAFLSDAEHFRIITREGSDVVKKYRTSIPPDLRVVLYENSSLYGALLPPVPGWDPVAQAAALAAGGKVDHGVPGLQGWDQDAILARIDGLRHYGRVHPSTDLTLRDWLERGDWERSGSASFGRVDYEITTSDGVKKGHFKARKNILMDVTHFTDLYSRVTTYSDQENKAIIKSELAKIRIAVASPLETYLQMSWMYALGGSFYLSWPGNTLEEPLAQEAARNELTHYHLSQGRFALPYDFAAFDHQPTKAEIKQFQDVIDGVAIMAATPQQQTEAELLHTLIQNGHDVATLHPPASMDSEAVFAVTGGLMSGLRTTSSVGSGWNGVLGTMAFDLLHLLTGLDVRSQSTLEIRGDDTKVVTSDYMDALAIKLLYDGLGAVANEAKFGLYRARVEFLRVEMSDRARAYPMRSVPGIMQRKPWNATPWREESVLAGLVKTCAVLRRRTPFPDAVDTLESHLRSRWFGRLGLDPRLGQIPITCGGLGLQPWDGSLVVRKWASDPPAPVRVTNRTDYRIGQIQRSFDRFGLDVDNITAKAVADNRLATKLAGDDVPALVPEIRARSRAELGRREIIATQVRTRHLEEAMATMADQVTFLETAPTTPGTFRSVASQAAALVRSYAPGFGAARRFMAKVSALAEIAKANRISLGQLLRDYAPDVFELLRGVERRYGLRRSQALDFVIGATSFSTAEQANPFVCRLASQVGAAALGYVRDRVGPLTAHEATWVLDRGSSCAAKGFAASPYGAVFLRV